MLSPHLLFIRSSSVGHEARVDVLVLSRFDRPY